MLKRDFIKLVKKHGKPIGLYIYNVSNGWLECYANQIIAIFDNPVCLEINSKIVRCKLGSKRYRVILEENNGVRNMICDRNRECDKRSEEAFRKYKKWCKIIGE